MKHAKYVIMWLQGEKIQVKLKNSVFWSNLVPHNNMKYIEHDFNDCNEYRVKPKTIKINGKEIEAPVTEPLEENTIYYIPHLRDEIAYYTWMNNELDKRLLKRGLIHLSYDNAIAHYNALISLTNGKE